MPAGKLDLVARATKKQNIKKKPIQGKLTLYKRRKYASRGAFKDLYTAGPFRPKMNVAIKYTQTNALTVGASGIYGTETVFRLNSPFDPDFTGIGHQNFGFDQLATLYRMYKVNAVKIEMVLTDPDADSLVVGATIQPSGSTFTLTGKAVDSIKEQPNSVTRSMVNSGNQLSRIVQKLPLYKIEGLSKVQWDADLSEYVQTTGSNPPKTPYLRVAVGNLRGVGAGSVVVRTTLTMYSTFYDRITFSQS